MKKEMLKIFQPISKLDWLNYRLVEKDVTLHHIIKKENGGRLEVNNLSLLMPVSHIYLHIIEYKDIKTYESINKLFKYINKQRHEPTLEQREIVEYLLREFENTHREDRNKKGKRLIREEYLERW